MLLGRAFPGATARSPLCGDRDGRPDGEILYSTNAETRLHPASLTKMLTLYIAFDAIERGEISLDTMVKVSKHAAAEPPSKLGLKPGQKIQLRYLIRAAAVKSANDAATAIGEAISGSEDAFAKRMNRTAKALGMKNSTFKNANGLTAPGHLSTAHDMTILGRRLFYDFPQYYNIFSRARPMRAWPRSTTPTAASSTATRAPTGSRRATRTRRFQPDRFGGTRQQALIATVFGASRRPTATPRWPSCWTSASRKRPTTRP